MWLSRVFPLCEKEGPRRFSPCSSPGPSRFLPHLRHCSLSVSPVFPRGGGFGASGSENCLIRNFLLFGKTPSDLASRFQAFVVFPGNPRFRVFRQTRTPDFLRSVVLHRSTSLTPPLFHWIQVQWDFLSGVFTCLKTRLETASKKGGPARNRVSSIPAIYLRLPEFPSRPF